jgi:RHS repeat-associated protein
MTNVTYPDGELVTYNYDQGGQVTSIAGTHLGASFSYVTAIGYDQYGQRLAMTLGNGAQTQYTYDPARRWLTEAKTTNSINKTLQDLTYTFDPDGNVLTLTSASTSKTTRQTYTYDNLDQLVTAAGNYTNNTYSLATTTAYAQSYNYDTLGNLIKKVSTLTRNPTTAADATMNYNLAYTYDSTHIHQPTHIGVSHYTYDLNGNLASIIPDSQWTGVTTVSQTVTAKDIKTGEESLSVAIGENRSQPTATHTGTGIENLAWDYANHLRQVKTDQADAFYDYDVDGERRLKAIGTTETVYADRMYEIESQPSRPLATVNIYLGDTRLVSKVVPISSPSTGYELQNTYYYHSDHIGNSTLITDYQGNEFERDAFTPHGELWQQDTLDVLDKIDYLFTGKEVDAETGWYNFGARYLNPTTGLWLSADPALDEYIPRAPLTDEDRKHNQNLPGYGGIFNPVNFALYHFAGNNPIRYTDPDGRAPGDYVPSNSIYGALTHFKVEGYLSQQFPSGTPERYLKGNGLFGLWGSGRVDFAMPSANGGEDFYEVKPISQFSGTAGDEQLQKYLNLAGEPQNNIKAEKGTGILSAINGKELKDVRFDLGDAGVKVVNIRIITDEKKHPGMIYYKLTEGDNQTSPVDIPEGAVASQIEDMINELIKQPAIEP